jgi:O-antigen/teichoic acid export membrane protein
MRSVFAKAVKKYSGTYRLKAFKSERALSVFKGLLSAVGSKILLAATTLVTLPIAVRYLGAERYGVWVTTTTVTSWIAMLDLGVAATLTNSISTAFAANDKHLAARQTTNALAITLVVVGVLGIFSGIAWANLDWVRLLNVSAQVSPWEVKTTVEIALGLVLLAPACTLGGKILSGYQQTHLYNLVTTGGALASFAGLIVGVLLHFKMPMLFLCFSGTVTACGVAALIWVLFFFKPWLRPRLSYINLAEMRGLIRDGAPLFLIQIACIVVFGTDNLVVSHYLGADQVTPYSVTLRLVTYAQFLPMFLFPSLWPAYAEADARGDYRWIRRTFILTMLGSLTTMLGLLTVFVLFGKTIIRLWAGSAAVPAESLLIAMSIWTLISALTGVQSCLLSAVGRARTQGIVSLASAVLNIILSIYLVQRIGSIGAVIGTIASYLLVVIIPQARDVLRYFSDHSKQVVLPHEQSTF